MKTFRRILQYLVVLGITFLLLYLAFGSISGGSDRSASALLQETWEKSDKGYLALMAAASLLSHIIRAIRWQMLLVPTGHRVSFRGSFLSLLTGYLVNLVVPRGGEVARSVNLNKLEKVPINISFGTVVTERVIDVILLFILVLVSFWVEWDKLSNFISALPIQSTGTAIPWWVIAALCAIAILVPLILVVRKNPKVRGLWGGFRDGLFSVFRLERRVLFVFHSLAIWILYFVSSYLILLAFEPTASLGLGAVLVIFAIGSIAMAVPLPGGTGSYHTLVPLGLVSLYGLPQPDAVAMVFIFHALQTLLLIVLGLAAVLISWFLIWRLNRQVTK